MRQKLERLRCLVKQASVSCHGRTLPSHWWDCKSAAGQQPLEAHGLRHGSTVRVDLPLIGGMLGQVKRKREISVLVVGDKGVGKTSLIRNFLYGNKLNTNQQPTKNLQIFKHHEKIIEKKTYYLDVYDMPGGKVEEITKTKLEKFDVYLFCYSLNSKKSLESVEKLYDRVKKLYFPDQDEERDKNKPETFQKP